MNLSGSPFDFVLAFAGGILVSFTPCVYPLIPVSAGYIGAGASGSRFRGLSLSAVYVTGIAVTYSLLGLLASLTGTFFGSISANPITRIVVGVIIILFALSMLDLFAIRLPGIKAPGLKKGNYLSTFLLGLASGLIVSPCLTPVLGSILLYLATKKNVAYGMFLLMCFAYGMGLVLILVGTFSSILVNLPKAGRWLNYIKRFFAVLLIITGLYFIVNAIRGL